MTKKYLNLIPEQYRFDLKKYAVLKIFNIILLANILILLSFFVVDKYVQIKLKQIKKEKEEKINIINKLNSSIMAYEPEKNKMEKIVSELNLTEKIYTSVYNTNTSYLVDLLRTINLISDGIYINSINYSNGTANITAIAKNARSFYQFYNNIENNKYIKDKKFYNLTESDNKMYSFNITVTFRGLNE